MSFLNWNVIYDSALQSFHNKALLLLQQNPLGVHHRINDEHPN